MRHPKADAGKRAVFKSKIRHYKKESRPIVYIDESGFAVDSPRTHGYSLKGRRCYGSHDWNAKGRINVIGAILSGKFVSATLFDCYIDSDVFHQWVVDDLLKHVPKNSVIVMDNASFHKRADIRASIGNTHTLIFQPPYSPDLNPIEKKWAHLKSIRKKHHLSVKQLFYQNI